MAILHHLDVAEVADLIMKDARLQLAAMIALGLRYRRHEEYERPFEAEGPWLASLERLLTSRAANQAPPFRQSNTAQLAERFLRIRRQFGGTLTPVEPSGGPGPGSGATPSLGDEA